MIKLKFLPHKNIDGAFEATGWLPSGHNYSVVYGPGLGGAGPVDDTYEVLIAKSDGYWRNHNGIFSRLSMEEVQKRLAQYC